jgi:hypothetical protein
MCRQPAAVKATGGPLATWAETVNGRAAKPIAKAPTETTRAVVLRHIDRVYCILSTNSCPWNDLNLYRFGTKNPIGYLLAKHF